MNRRLFATLVAAMLLLTAALPGLALGRAPAAQFSKGGIYIVQLSEKPVVAYEGGVRGLKATKPSPGNKIDPNATDVVRYVGHLTTRHAAELKAAGGGQKIYDFAYSFNGFAAQLTASAANKLAADPDVISVTPEQEYTVDTSSTPDFLGLTDEGGLWEQLGGPSVGKFGTGAGEDIVIGIVDSGIWPESLSFSDRNSNGKLVYQPLNTSLWHGKKCEAGEGWVVSGPNQDCNKKLIGARYYNASWGGSAALEAERPWEFMSPRDYNGHGSHTASTSGGNHDVPTTGPAAALGSISGMAPRARIAAYKALWSNEDASQASGRTGDLVAAVDQAVADGVDVINYSISGTTTNFLDPVEIAFLFAADAGVFVAASAGNSGPGSSTVAHPSPWITTVAAGTHNRSGTGSVTLGNGDTYTGASLATAVGPAPLINASDAALPGADPTEVELCFSTVDTGGTPVLDPAKVAGKIVVCDRGITARVNKSLAVLEAGGVGAILINTSPASLNADFHFVPTVHLPDTDLAAVHAYAATAGATATINQATIDFDADAPFTASFSSRGPLLAGAGDVLKPDVIAPGVDILAAVAPPGNHGLDFNLYSGTSMSSPHVAGLAALMKQLRPTWSPMAIKSALMTTGYDVLDGGTPAPNTNPVLIFRQGAGHVEPTSAADPGLVYDSGFLDWLAFLCGTTSGVNPATCTALAGQGFSLDPSDFNSASIAIGALAGVQSVTRTVTNVGDSAATYNVSVNMAAGVDVDVSPSSLTLDPGESASFEITFTRTTAALNAYAGGQMTWSDGSHSVRSPIVVRSVALAAPAEVEGTGDPISYEVTFGYDGTFTATARGLIPATETALTVTDDPNDSFVKDGPGTVFLDIPVVAGSSHLRASLFDDFTDGADDLDLYLYNPSGTLIAISGSGTSAEELNVVNPVTGTYRVYVHGFATEGPDSNFTLFSWVLGTADAGNMTVTAPAAASTGATGTIDLTFSGLDPSTKYLGSVAYGGVAGLPNPTIVRVDTP